jgi:hypothetical protein
VSAAAERLTAEVLRNLGGHAPDVGRRIIQCAACDRVLAWRGEVIARERGWGSKWVDVGGRLCRTWACRDCYVPPAPPDPPEATLPGYLLQLLRGLGTGRHAGAAGEDLAREQLALMRQLEPARFSGCIAELETEIAAMGPGRRRGWAAWARALRRPPKASRARSAA